MALFAIFQQASSARPPLAKRNIVAPPASFEAALRATYPKAKSDWIQRMLRLVRSEQRAIARRQWMQRARHLEPEICRLFGYIDSDGSKTIALQEFLKAAADAGINDTETMEALFHSKDTDQKGTLDIAEFTSLVGDCPRLLERFDDIVTASAKSKRRQEERERRQSTVFGFDSSAVPECDAEDSGAERPRPSLADLRSAHERERIVAAWRMGSVEEGD